MFGSFQFISLLILLGYSSFNFLEDYLVTLISLNSYKMEQKAPNTTNNSSITFVLSFLSYYI